MNKINFFRKKKIGNEFFLTNDLGKYIYLPEEDYNNLITENLENISEINKFKLEQKGFIKTDNREFEKIRERNSFLGKGPSLHIVVVTLRCDQKCVYCHASSKPCSEKQYDMTIETARKVVDRILESNSDMLNIEFQGGEPLLNFEVIKFIMEEINKRKQNRNVLFSLVSNFALMNDEIADFLIKNNIGICTSLDGPEELHNKNRNKYKETVDWIKRLQEKPIKHEISASLTITKDSLQYPKEIVDEYIKNKLNVIHVRPLKKLGYAKENKNIYYTIEEYIEFWKKIMDYILEVNETTKLVERETLFMLKKIVTDHDPNYLELRSPCGAVIGQLLYNYDGKIFTCDEGRMMEEDTFCVGNVDQSIKEITTSDEAMSIISSSINDANYCNRCVYKPYCGLCPVLNYAEFGTTIGRVAESEWCKLHMAQFNYIFEKLRNPKTKSILLSWI